MEKAKNIWSRTTTCLRTWQHSILKLYPALKMRLWKLPSICFRGYRVKPQLCPNKISLIVESELRISTIVDERAGFRGARCFHKEDSHLDLYLDLLASLHLLGGKAALNRPTLLSQFLRFDILEITGIVSSVLTAPSRQFYWQYKRSEAARRQPSGSAAGRQRLAWQWEIREEKEAEALSYNYIICHQKTSVVVTIFRWLLLKVTPIKILTIMFWQRLAWRCETWEETDLWRPRGEQFEFETPLSRDIPLWYIYCYILDYRLD